MELDAPGYLQLEAFRRCDDLAVALLPISRELRSVDRGLASQVFQAAVSAPANIAEGYGRASSREFVRFLEIAHGSLFEKDYFLHFIDRAQLIDSPRVDQLRQECRTASKLVYGLMKSQRAKLQTEGDRRYPERNRRITFHNVIDWICALFYRHFSFLISHFQESSHVHPRR